MWIGVLVYCIAVALDGFGLFECVGNHRLVVARVLTGADGDSSGMFRSMISNGEHSLHDMYPKRLTWSMMYEHDKPEPNRASRRVVE